MSSPLDRIRNIADNIIADRAKRARPKKGPDAVLEQLRKTVEDKLVKDHGLTRQDDTLDLALFVKTFLDALDDAGTTYKDHVAGCAITYIRAVITRDLEKP